LAVIDWNRLRNAETEFDPLKPVLKLIPQTSRKSPKRQLPKISRRAPSKIDENFSPKLSEAKRQPNLFCAKPKLVILLFSYVNWFVRGTKNNNNNGSNKCWYYL